MTRDQAAIMLSAIEDATDGNWPNTAARLQERGYSPKEIMDAWGALEKEAGMSGTVPSAADFS